jgi:mannose-1-phosphate guanylyltransferase
MHSRSKHLFLIVMAGGSGMRFWPKSTSRAPKQLLSFGAGGGGHPATSLLQQTLSRFDGLVPAHQRLIVTTESLKDAVAAQAADVTILAEPQGRNTAPCIYWAARTVAEQDPTGVMLVMPSDHYIALPDKFVRTIRAAAERAATNPELVTLGVKPSRPETGYGYLKIGGALHGSACRRVEAFVEKPELSKARAFVKSGRYLWNGGMFLWQAQTILDAFDQHMPEMKQAWNRARGQVKAAYPKLTATSIDFGVMEKARNVVAFPLDCGWDDLGSWTSLEHIATGLRARHEAGVVVPGTDVVSIKSQGNIVDAQGKLVALLGVEDLIVVEYGNSILVGQKSRAQDLRLIVEQVKRKYPERA